MTVKESEYPELLSDFHEIVNMDVRCLLCVMTVLQHRIINAKTGLTVCNPARSPAPQAQELEEWLQTAESQNTGMKREGEDEAVGHVSGR